MRCLPGNAYLCRLGNKSSPLKRKNVARNKVANNREVSRQKKVASTQSVTLGLGASVAARGSNEPGRMGSLANNGWKYTRKNLLDFSLGISV